MDRPPVSGRPHFPPLRPAMTYSRLNLFLAALLSVSTVAESLAQEAGEDFFENKIRPLLAERCFECHGSKKQQGDVRLDVKAAVFGEGPSGRIVVPGQPGESRLLKVIAHDPYDTQMPPDGKLPEEEVKLLTEWIQRGAVWPDTGADSSPKGEGGYDFAAVREGHWAFRDVAKPSVPQISDAARAQTPVDHFLLAKLEKHGLSYSAVADKRTLLRRAFVDLVGVPPTAADVAEFEADRSSDAFERRVDRLLASPLYGQRWGRHWLDVARYADTKGYVFTEDMNYPYAYTYRDYVIGAFNDDKSYNRFILEQIAADQLGLDEGAPELAALGFLTVGRRNLNNRMDIIDDRIDVTTRGLMGLTVACARCHDHKFDPVPTADYYSLYGVFDSSDDPAPSELPLIGTPEKTKAYVRFQEELDRRQAEVAKYVAEQREVIATEMRLRAGDYLTAVLQGPDAVPNLRRKAIEDWKQLLRKAGPDDALWGPWARVSGLPSDGFADQARSTLELLRQETSFRDGLGKFVLDRLALEPLQDKTEVARAYGKILKQVVERPEGLVAEDAAPFDAIAAKLGESGTPFVITDDVAKQYFDRAQRNEERNRQRKVDAFRSSSDAAPPRAMVLRDRATPVEPVVFVRGNPGRRGDKVERHFLELLSDGSREAFPKDASGRRQLAESIADDSNPLTARVFVNRVWQHHFGQGIVQTSSDFGTRAEPPTHPELLDWLAAEFVEADWSIKRLHRMIVLSAAYQQSSLDRSVDDPRLAELDPTNRWVWRMNPRRLEFESMRDATLAVAGRLDPSIGGRPIHLFKDNSLRRTVYGYVNRNDLPGVWRSFDFPSPDASVGERPETTVPQQSLFAMNSPFVIEQAKALATRADSADELAVEEEVQSLYQHALQRSPRSDELAAAVAFLEGSAPAESELNRWEQLAQVLLLTNEFTFID